eukprot:6670042-Pyramimonas_sp.AAC.1
MGGMMLYARAALDAQACEQAEARGEAPPTPTLGGMVALASGLRLSGFTAVEWRQQEVRVTP